MNESQEVEPPVEIPGRIWDGHPHQRHLHLTVGSRVVYEEFPNGFGTTPFVGTVTSPPVQARGYDGAWSVMVQWDANIDEGPVDEPCGDLAIIERGAS